MSYRSTRRRTAGNQRWLSKAAIGLLVLGLIGLGAGYGLIRSYLHSDAFRKFLSAEASRMARVRGEFAHFRWDGLAVNTDSFEATSDGPITAVKANDLHTEIGLGGLTRGVWEIRGSSVRRLDVSVDPQKQGMKPPLGMPQPKPKITENRPSWFPNRAELQGIEVQELTLKVILENGPFVASDVAINFEKVQSNHAYRAEAKGGQLRLPVALIPEARLEQAQLRYQNKQIYLTNATVTAWSDARFQCSGEWDMQSRHYSVEGDVTGIQCENLLNADWSKRLAGNVTSTFKSNNFDGYPQASGKLIMKDAVLTALPILDALAAYADTRRFRVISLHEAHTDWQWKKHEISLQNLVLASEGLIRLEGSLVIRGEELEGHFRLGLAPGTLSTIPGAETDVFSAGERGLLWTPLHVTGTLDEPKEDLSRRLIAAAGLRMFEQLPDSGEKVIQFTNSVLGESPSKTVKKGLKIIENNSDTIREVSGILDGILGSSRKENPNKEDEAQ